jgi:hypothetical protein
MAPYVHLDTEGIDKRAANQEYYIDPDSNRLVTLGTDLFAKNTVAWVRTTTDVPHGVEFQFQQPAVVQKIVLYIPVKVGWGLLAPASFSIFLQPEAGIDFVLVGGGPLPNPGNGINKLTFDDLQAFGYATKARVDVHCPLGIDRDEGGGTAYKCGLTEVEFEGRTRR